MRKLVWIMGLFLFILLSGCGNQQSSAVPAKTVDGPKPVVNANVILATTTSTQDSGLLDVILPVFEKKTGYKVKTIAVGTGQALAMGSKGEADLLLVHAPAAEKKLMESGAAVRRRLVMHNDFVFVGPSADEAKIKGKSTIEALKSIAGSTSRFISRGDDSGTHKMELSLWKSAGIKPAGTWYQEAGAGMGQTLKIADEKMGYTLTDRATYLAQKKNLRLGILVEGDAKLLNIYHVMEVNPAKFNKVNNPGAKALADYLLSTEGQAIIASFGKEKFGQPLFFADGGKTEKEFGF